MSSSRGAVRWVLDYRYRIGQHEGGGGKNIAEAGWQWQIADAHKLGMSVQPGRAGPWDLPSASSWSGRWMTCPTTRHVREPRMVKAGASTCPTRLARSKP